ncbi:hypothetical protein ACM39_16775 [Chryseobacterium sp. FH2]|uniref:hypothetical protein n=1 Tax=Chryseobacterium sp. FH2 TaxID=1674291 RepID=UPI00065ABD76|nr:hypothetical protein [Chryseobacterium sp. FH2]KMQ65326.1 hypothetical protein ACM39_16775 [Chryseobacterium sp. FH2]
MKKSKMVIFLSLLLTIFSCNGKVNENNKKVNTIEDTIIQKQIKIEISDVRLINKSLKQKFKINTESSISLENSDLFFGEDRLLIDSIFYINEIKSGINYNTSDSSIKVYDIYYLNNKAEYIYNKIDELSKNARKSVKYFEFFKRGMVILLNKEKNCLTLITYNATISGIRKEIERKINEIKSEYNKVKLLF